MRVSQHVCLWTLAAALSGPALVTGQVPLPQTTRQPGEIPAASAPSPMPPLKSVERQAPFPGSEFPPWQDALAGRIGWRLSQAVEELGAPLSVWPARGDQAFQDSVVFYYPDNIYIYFWDDRIWQIRLDKRYKGKAFGVTMGQTIALVRKTLGEPGENKAGWLRYSMPDRGWPVELLLYFEKDLLVDLYVRRSDF